MGENLNEVDILMVEDNKNDVELTLRALKKNNLANHMFVVEDGEEALNFIFARDQYSSRDINFPPKVIFLDLKLPKVNGIEVLKQIKSDERTKTIPVVVVTSSQETQDVKECYSYGVNSFIQKPIEFDNFAKAISDAGLYWIIINKSPR